jgi:hypothetical protein
MTTPGGGANIAGRDLAAVCGVDARDQSGPWLPSVRPCRVLRPWKRRFRVAAWSTADGLRGRFGW